MATLDPLRGRTIILGYSKDIHCRGKQNSRILLSMEDLKDTIQVTSNKGFYPNNERKVKTLNLWKEDHCFIFYLWWTIFLKGNFSISKSSLPTNKEKYIEKMKKILDNYFKHLKKIFFNWRIIALQYCAGFCHTTTWISHKYTYIPPFWISPRPPNHKLPLILQPLPPPTKSHPSKLLQSMRLSSLGYTATSNYLSLLQMVLYICQCYSLNSFQPLLPTLHQQVSNSQCCFILFYFFSEPAGSDPGTSAQKSVRDRSTPSRNRWM